MPFLIAQSPIGAETWGRVSEMRTTYGDLVVMTEVAAFMITIGVLPSVATGAAASASGVNPKPTRKSTLSRVTSSCARRLATSGTGPVVSRRRISIFLPATVSPCSFIQAFMPFSICLPTSANGPENDAISPSLIVPPGLASPLGLSPDLSPDFLSQAAPVRPRAARPRAANAVARAARRDAMAAEWNAERNMVTSREPHLLRPVHSPDYSPHRPGTPGSDDRAVVGNAAG